MKIVIVGGMPGTGKTTLMKQWMSKYRWMASHKEVKLVPFYVVENLGKRIYVLGKYEEGEVFGGTDRMSMAAQPEVIKFLDSLSGDIVVVMEGDRLFTPSFLEHCSEKYTTRIFVLTAEKELLATRYADRGSNQDPTWLKGRESKVNGILTNMMLMDNTEVYPHETPEDTDKIIQRIEDFIWRE